MYLKKRRPQLHVLAIGVLLAMIVSFVVPMQVQRADATTVGEAASQKAELEQQLKELQSQIAEKQGLLAGQKQKSASLQNDIAILETKIAKAQLEIQARDITINQLTGNIADTQQKVETLEGQIDQSEKELANLIRETDKKDNYTLVEVILGSKNFSDFFTDAEAISSLKDDLKNTLDAIEQAHVETKGKEVELTAQKVEQQNLREVQALQKKDIESNQAEKSDLLKQSKSKENFYEDTITHTQQEIDQIKAALFKLQGSNTSINFGQAYSLAKQVEDYTGVRPAFLLAILTQETNIGQNVGTCNLPGQPASRMWQAIMKPSRDQAPYLRIVKSLGISPTARPLSCPQSVGWGGAMGPAQFIPSTWEQMISSVQMATGSNPPDPWDPRDAFFAAGIYLRDLGAGAGTYSAEMMAAGKYFAGSNWNDPNTGQYYAQSVENLADSIQNTKINPIENSQ